MRHTLLFFLFFLGNHVCLNVRKCQQRKVNFSSPFLKFCLSNDFQDSTPADQQTFFYFSDDLLKIKLVKSFWSLFKSCMVLFKTKKKDNIKNQGQKKGNAVFRFSFIITCWCSDKWTYKIIARVFLLTWIHIFPCGWFPTCSLLAPLPTWPTASYLPPLSISSTLVFLSFSFSLCLSLTLHLSPSMSQTTVWGHCSLCRAFRRPRAYTRRSAGTSQSAIEWGSTYTAWCKEIDSLTSPDAPECYASSDVRGPISLHQAVLSQQLCKHKNHPCSNAASPPSTARQ